MELGWYADPIARHERRFYDGRRWTEHVADGDVLAIDEEQPGVAAVAPPVTRTQPVTATRAPTRSDLFEWGFRVAMVSLLVLFLVAAALNG
jgi:hypothetical protein